jgi:hypothetical protein
MAESGQEKVTREERGDYKVKDERLASLKLMAALSGVEVKTREICSEFYLLTFDLPTTEEGNKARAKFYERARRAGAVPHTESVYYLPTCPESELAIVEVAEAGNAFVWTANVKDEDKARILTEKYDKSVNNDILKELNERVTKMEKHAEDGKEAVVNRMRKKTQKMLVDAAGIAARRGSEKLARQVEKLKTRCEEIKVADSSSWVSELKGLL